MAKVRFNPNDTPMGMTVNSIEKDAANYRHVIYSVTFACEHVEQITGNALTNRIRSLRVGEKTNLCTKCANKQWRKGSEERRQRKLAQKNILSISEALALLPAVRRQQ